MSLRPAVGRPAGRQHVRAVLQAAAYEPAAARSYSVRQPLLRLRPASNPDNLLFLGGLLLLVGGLVAGLLIGGGPGLLVGLVLGIPGYLLLGRGYAGSWKSVARPAGSFPARQLQPAARSLRTGSATRPADAIDGLGIFFAKVGAVVALVFLLAFILGLSYNLFLLALIGGIGFLLAVLHVALILSVIPRWWRKL